MRIAQNGLLRRVVVTGTVAAMALAVGLARTDAGTEASTDADAGAELPVVTPSTIASGATTSVAEVATHRPSEGEILAAAQRLAIDAVELRGQLERGEAELDASGMLRYLDRFDVDEHSAATDDGSALANAHNPARPAALPYDQTFTLHSRPGAAKVAYLDFDGANVADTGWNETYTYGAPFDVSSYDIDGDPGSFSAAEHDAIQDIWQRVSEDFAPFEIDVTTQAPSADAVLRSDLADLQFGMRIVITNTTLVYANCQCGGLSYVGSFNYVNAANPARSHAFYGPGFVFQQGVGYSPKTIAEAASHELGHTLGLKHDETVAGAYSGHGDWAPIMGTAYSKPITQWSRGEFTGATAETLGDDFVTIQQHGGTLVADDVADVISGAHPLGGGGSYSGTISTASDRDVFSFTTAGGPVSISVSPALVSPDLDAALELLDGSGNVIAADDPPAVLVSEDYAQGLGAIIRTQLAPGTYYARVDGVGSGDPGTNGYSDYASVGRYTVSVTTGLAANTAPRAVAAASSLSGRGPFTVTFSSVGSSDGDGTITSFRWDFGDGTSAAEPNPTHTFGAAGGYSVVLAVTDDQGATSTATLSVTVTTAGNRVSALELTMLARSTSRNYATAGVTMTSPTGGPLSRALVLGAWSGSDKRWVLGITDANGHVDLTSLNSPRQSSAYGFTVLWAGYLEAPADWTSASMTSAVVWAGGPQYWAASSPS